MVPPSQSLDEQFRYCKNSPKFLKLVGKWSLLIDDEIE